MTIKTPKDITECFVKTGPRYSQAHALLLIRLAMFTVASLAICQADPKTDENAPVLRETESAAAVRHSDWCKALQAEFRYTPSAPGDPGTVPEATVATPVSPDVVVLPRFAVRGAAPYDRESQKAMGSPSQGENKVLEKLGIGRHEIKFRHFSIGWQTIFYIPVALGIRW